EWMAAWLPHVLWAPRFVSLPSTPLTPDFTLIKDTSELAREGVLTDQQIFSSCTGLFVSKPPQVRGVFKLCGLFPEVRGISSHVDILQHR
ncbi:hypothetical protein CXB38_27960, partial [Pseudomonas syringae]|uniref:hypothetical protein n=1 Tax=Pseudomonas syringae TaxID=317 RepID=UPI000D400A13